MKMDEEIIKEIVLNVKKEIVGIDDVSGLCFYTSNNISYDLNALGIKNQIFNIRDLADADYDHYFVLANSNYLIDLTYSQFLKKENHTLRFFDEWPSEILLKSEKGKIILEDLLSQGYIITDNEMMNLYLKSFNEYLDPIFTLGDLTSKKSR